MTLNPRQFHATYSKHVESIKAEGLKSRLSVMGDGVYGFHTLEAAQGYGQRTGKDAVVEFRPTKIKSTHMTIKGAPHSSVSEAVPPGNIIRVHR